jgi:adhesin transport system outer membrane protein
MQPVRTISAVLLACSLSACATETSVDPDAAAFAQTEGETVSPVISELMARRSLLEDGSPYGTVAEAVLDASERASESELISAKLRAEAASKNWLPTLGPSVSLTDLGDLVAGILIEQVLFDNGRRKAEREFAAADVEVAAVGLSIDMNARVETALGLYIAGLRGDEKAALGSRALVRMQEFDRIVTGRVEGGLVDRSDQTVVRNKINGMRSARTTALEAAATARAELKAMTGQDFPATHARLNLETPPESAGFLTVLKAESVATRTVAQTKVQRAGLLPQVSASGTATSDGSGAGLTLNTPVPLGLGTPALLQAIETARETAQRQVGEAEETARRDYARQMQRLASFRRQASETAELAKASRDTYDLFQAQFKAGQRPVMDVVTIYEQLVQREQAHVDAKYEVVLTQLALARDMGLLANGDEI